MHLGDRVRDPMNAWRGVGTVTGKSPMTDKILYVKWTDRDHMLSGYDTYETRELETELQPE